MTSEHPTELVCFVPLTDIDAPIAPCTSQGVAPPRKQQVCRQGAVLVYFPTMPQLFWLVRINRSISRLLAQLRGAPNLSLHGGKGITRGEGFQPAFPDFRRCEAPGG